MPDPRAITRTVLEELNRLAEREPGRLPGFHPVQVGEVLDRAATHVAVEGTVDLNHIVDQLRALRIPDATAALVADAYGHVAAQHGVAVTPRTAPAAAPAPSPAPAPRPATPPARPLPDANLPESLPVALADLVRRHDRLPGVDADAARAFLARELDRGDARVLDLTPVFTWLQGRGADDDAIHEVMLSLSAVGHALGHRAALPAATAALKPTDRARLLQAFVQRCPATPPPTVEATTGKVTAPPPPAVDDDYMVSVVTNTLVRERRKRTAGVAAALGGVVAIALALIATLVLDDEEAPSELDLPPPPEAAGKAPPAPGSKEARAAARFALSAAEKHLTAGELRGARVEAERARTLDPELPEAAQVLSVVARRAGDAEGACRHMKEYLRKKKPGPKTSARLLKSACPD